jgi:hypothetical protein
MTSRIIAGIAFKLFAIWLLVRTILTIPIIWQGYLTLRNFRSPEGISIVWPVIIFISLLIASLLVMKIIWSLGTKAINDFSDTPVGSESHDIEQTLFQILGLYFLITSLTIIPYHVLQILEVSSVHQFGQGLRIFTELTRLVIGLLLIYKANFWRSFFQQLRYAGSAPYNHANSADRYRAR